MRGEFSSEHMREVWPVTGKEFISFVRVRQYPPHLAVHQFAAVPDSNINADTKQFGIPENPT